jgi:triacylglycerol lipase
MPDGNNALTPYESALAANNVYYTLKGWSASQAAKRAGDQNPPKPSRGMERLSTVKKEVTGSGTSSLQKAGIQGKVKETFQATTGIDTRTGFGYILKFTHNQNNHAIVATRGTRPEIGKPDLVTDLYSTPTARFLDAGLVHRGFALTFESLKGRLEANAAVFEDADYIHCVGHSLGGAVANLVAYYLQASYPNTVRLYTFGAPRVGTYFGLPAALERNLGKDNIYRVSHHLDPITMIPTFPFLHVLGSDDDANNCVLISPAKGPSMKNHSMDTYAREMQGESWDGVRRRKYLPDFEDRLMKSLWESESDHWFKKGIKLLGGAAVWLLMKILKGILKALAGAIIALIATPLDLIARLLYFGVQQVGKLGRTVLRWIQSAGEAIGLAVTEAKDVTVTVLQYLLDRLLSGVRNAANACLDSLEAMGELGYNPAFPTSLAAGMMYAM